MGTEKAILLGPEAVDLETARRELKSLILNHGIAWGSGKNKDNKPYNWVFDTKSFLLNPRGLYLTSLLFLDKIRKYSPGSVGGLTLASHLIASSMVYLSSSGAEKLEGFLVRREQKAHGLLKLVEGPELKNKKVVIIDDGLNAAGFASQAIKAAEEAGCKVLAVIVLINFEKKDHYDLKNRGYNVENIFTLQELGLDTRHAPLKADMYALKWRYSPVIVTDYTAPKSSPVVDSGRVFIGSDQGKMLCLDFSGNLLWEFNTDFHPHGVHQTPIIVGSKVIFSGYDGGIYAINKEKGALIWKNKASSFNGSSPIYDGESNMVYIGLENSTLKGTMAALDADTGKLIWELSTNEHVPSRAAIGKNILVFGSNDCFLYACDKYDGKLLWKFRAYGAMKGRLTVDGNLCYATSFDGFLYCIDLAGKQVWKKRLGKLVYNEPVIFEDNVLVGSYSGQLTALDKRTGRIEWHFMCGGPIQSYPLCHDGIVYFGSHDKNIYAVDARDGTLLWNFQTGGIVTSSPAIHDGMLLISSFDGYLYCFERNK